MAKLLDPMTSYALAGMADNDPRLPRLDNATWRLCDGCGATIWLSAQIIPEAEAVARQHGKTLHIVCDRCGRPWLEMVERGQGIAEATGVEAAADLLDKLRGVRRDRVQRN